MAETALERTSRALDLIPFVAANPGLSIEELAIKFESTPSQIFKDLEMLFMCGLPGYTHLELIDMELEEDYVAIRNPQNLDKPRKLSRIETASLTLGLDLLIPLIGDEELKRKAVDLRGRFTALLNEDAEPIATVIQGEENSRAEVDAVIAQALAQQSSLEITYRSASTDEISTRIVSPISTYVERNHLYTIAFCSKAGEERHFRHDRILSARATEVSERQKTERPRLVLEKPDLLEVTALLAPRNRYFLEAHRSIVESVVPHGSDLLATFSIGDYEWLLRELLALPGRVEVLGPPEFLREFYGRLDAVLSQYR